MPSEPPVKAHPFGADLAIEDEDYVRLALELEWHPADIETIAQVESAGFGRFDDGRIKICSRNTGSGNWCRPGSVPLRRTEFVQPARRCSHLLTTAMQRPGSDSTLPERLPQLSSVPSPRPGRTFNGADFGERPWQRWTPSS